MQRAKAFIFAGKEDFGITLVEAQACGTPVIAYRAGGAMETVRGLETDNPTGVFFEKQCADDIIDAIKRFEQHSERIDPAACRQKCINF